MLKDHAVSDALDKRMGRFEAKLDVIDTRLRTVEAGQARIDGKLDLVIGQMPKWYQAPISAAGLLALLLAALGAADHLGLLRH